MEPQQPPYYDPLQTNMGYMPQQRMDIDSAMSKHLDASDMILEIKNRLMGMEYDDNDEEWKLATRVLGYDKDGKEVTVPEDPVMEPKEIRMLIGFLQTHLNSNTFLSQIDDERTNDIMWNVSLVLGTIFYNLRNNITPNQRAVLWLSIEDAILFALGRANRKITLDAFSKVQHTQELIQANPRTPTSEKDFKVWGW